MLNKREKCKIIDADCEYFYYRCDRNGEVVIVFCDHADNTDKYEGNCQHSLCPIIGEPSEDYS